MISWLEHAMQALADRFPEGTFLNFPSNLYGLVAVILVCLICGAVGSLVVGNRMAFFSDALAHCAFAGVALGILAGLFLGEKRGSGFYHWGILVIMVLFGVLVGLGIAFVREKTALTSDTVIGVFFAGAVGFGAMLFKALNTRGWLSPENFLFGDPVWVTMEDLLILLGLVITTGVVLVLIYNQFVFTSFNSSLAKSRRISLRTCNYVFIVLLALIVNLSLKTVGALLINALLIVPAATASNLSRNLRQMFWLTTILALFVGVAGFWLSWEISIPDPGRNEAIHVAPGGTIVVFSVILFFISMAVGPRLRRRAAV